MCRVRSADFNQGLGVLQFWAENLFRMKILFDGTDFVHFIRSDRDNTTGFENRMFLVGKIKWSLQEASFSGLPAS